MFFSTSRRSWEESLPGLIPPVEIRTHHKFPSERSVVHGYTLSTAANRQKEDDVKWDFISLFGCI